jgi:hypothetical protein
MSQFSPRYTFGGAGIPAPMLNRMSSASEFVVNNQEAIAEMLGSEFSGVGQMLMQVVSSATLSSNRWAYTLKLCQPDSAGTAVTAVTQTELTGLTAYNLSEFGNTSSVAGGGVNATRANAAGFNLLAVPDNSVVWAIVVTKADGLNVALFERMNQYDGECPSALINVIDGGSY